jgi:hypothetical protein
MQKSNKSNKSSISNKKATGKSSGIKRGIPVGVSSKGGASLQVDYVVSSREHMATLSGNSAPFLLLGSSGTFPGYDLNPGNRLVFPWLSLVASAYEKYRFEQLSFEVVPRNPSTVSGAVYLALDYDWDDNPATNVAEFMSNRGAINSDVWTPATLNVDVRRLNEDVPWRYVADFPRTDSSQRMVYGGFLMLAIAGTSASVSFDVYVNYRVKLSLPALHSVDSTATYTLPAAKVIAAGGNGHFESLPTISGIVSVLTGVAGTPMFSGGTAPPANTAAYRIGTAGKGELTLNLQPASAGSAPNSFVTDSLFDGGVFDANGVFQGAVSTAGLASAALRYPGPDVVGDWAVAGATARAAWTLSLAALRRVFPLGVYILPYLYSAAGRTLSTSTKLTARYTEL